MTEQQQLRAICRKTRQRPGFALLVLGVTRMFSVSDSSARAVIDRRNYDDLLIRSEYGPGGAVKVAQH